MTVVNNPATPDLGVVPVSESAVLTHPMAPLIPAPPYADAGYKIVNTTTPALYLKLDKALATGSYIKVGIEINGAYKYETSNVQTAQFDLTTNIANLIVGYKPSYEVKDGTYKLEGDIYSSSGTLLQAPTYGTLLIDTKAPDTTGTLTSLSSDTGLSPTDFITNVAQQTLKGALSAALANGSASGVSHEMLKVDVLGSDGKSVIGGPANADDAALGWSYALPKDLADGTYTVQTWVADAAGNDNQANAQTQKIVIDTVAPTQVTTIAPIPDTTVTSGIQVSGKLDKPLADGTANGISKEYVQIKIDGGDWKTVDSVDPATNQWSYTIADTLKEGEHTISVQVLDVAGNVDANTADQTFKVKPPDYDRTYTVGTPYAGLGYAMTAISDFNGDGYADYLVSAPGTHYGNLLAAGKSVMYLLYGSATGLPDVTNLDTITAAQGIRITSSSKSGSGLQGQTVTDIGDFNGDGLSDVAISSKTNNTTYILFGQAGNATQPLDLDKLTPQQGFSVTAAGWAPASAAGADVNGDGYSDLIVSNVDGGSHCAGAAYVIYGHAGTQGNIAYGGITVKGAAAGYTIESGTSGLGTVLSAVGDVNGDGYTDFVATLPGSNHDSGSNLSGSACLVFGGPNGVSQPGTTSVDLLKASASQAIWINASNYYEHLGGQAGYGGNTLNADALKAEFHSVASLGNIDGSGVGAFALGSPGASPGTGKATTAYGNGTISEGAGAVYVLYGQTNWNNIVLPSWSSATKTWSGSSLNGTNGFVIYSSSFANQANGKLAGASDLGFSVNSAGDVNGDGIDDFLIGAPAAYGGKGAAYLVFGQAGGLDWKLTAGGTAVVNLDDLVAAGKTGAVGQPGTAIEYIGTTTVEQQPEGGSNMGTDVTGGDFTGTGIHGYSFSAWGQTANGVTQAGEVYVKGGITALLTQPIYNDANGHVYYAGSGGGPAPIKDGVDLIATGTGKTNWVHGVGVDDTAGPFTTTVQHDAVSGGAGSDFIGIVSTNFTGVNGGNGTDTLVFEGSNITLNLKEMGLRVQGFEQFDLSNSTHTAAGDPNNLFAGQTHDNTLALRLSDVLSQMSNAPNSQRMTIMGDAASNATVDLTDTGWAKSDTQTVGTMAFDVWHNAAQGSNTTADLLIQQGVQVTMTAIM